ncbi:hypothetical protein ONE63_000382 [Megalurothrips usitatus]|uniref:LIM zinc-binding domain-containing protein n=1 Tax=Megalurothrips usitatus TaxID=439358 RepID=A0AAV7XY94_9NEOP|nr:hypothetical protein ONE63_000382 [Megalurothrips usitatus]
MNLPCSNSENGEGERNLDYAPPTIVSQLAKIKLSGTVPQDKFSSRPEVVSPEALCPDHSQVLVDLPNSHSSSKSVAVSSKTYSAQHSCLPTIPEVSHDSPPKVFVSDTEPITPAHCTEASIPPTTTSSPLENENIFGCIDETEIASQMSRAVVLVSDRIEEGKNICLQDETCMPNDNPDETCVSCEEVPSSQSVETVSPAEMSISTVNPSLHLVEEQEKDVADVSVAEGSKSYCINATSKDSQIIVDQATSIEADSDVSSFLDQALFEEDLKMEGSTLSGNEKGSDLHLPLSHSVTKNDVSITGTSTLAEPPKEKPPPPPVELSDDEDHTAQPKNQSTGSVHIECQKPNLGRLDSTKRIKKDIRRKRSDFLGIEGNNDDSYLDTELKVTPPPDMTSFLQEERRLEQELYRQMQPTLYPESDHGSNQGESRDSGVELDNHLHSHNLLTDFSNEDQSCENHSRQSSEPFGNASSTSEEDEIIKKEREIIEILEKEEQWRYGTNTILSPSDHHQVGEKLAAKLRELEQEKMRLEWERAEETRKAAAEQAARQDEQRRIRIKEEQLRQQESIVGRLPADVPFDCDPSDMTPEALREERERLKQEQAELDRQREILAANQMSSRQSWDSSSSSTAHRSLQDVSGSPHAGSHNQLNVPASNTPLNCRLSLPDLQQSDFAVHPMGVHHHRPPPPIPPSKPLSVVSQESHGVNGHARQPQLQSSSDSLTISSESHHHRHNAVGLPSVPMASSPTSSTGSQQMTRQTLHALSAAPRSKIIATDTWVQAKRKPESQRNSNRDHYQHWLIQEAEHRRITEQQQRNATSRKSLPPNFAQGHSQPKLTTQPAQQPPPQSWQYQHPHHQSNVHQMPHQHHHSHVHSHPQFSHGPVQATAPPVPPPPRQEKPLPDAIIQSLTQRVQNRVSINENNRRHENSPARDGRPSNQVATNIINNNNNNNLSNININHGHTNGSYAANTQEKMLSVSGKKKCSHCNEELGRGAAMIIESLRLFYHMDCFKCCVCHVQLGDGLMGTDVRVRNHKLHCHNCYSSDDGVKFSCV